MPERRHKYQPALKNKKDRSLEMRKFRVKKGVNYLWVPVRNFDAKKDAKHWIKEDRKQYHGNAYYRTVKNSKRIKPHRNYKNYTVYRVFYP